MTATGVKFRSSARASLILFLGKFKATHEGRVRAVHRSRPSSFNALPCLFVQAITDARIHFLGYGNRQRDLSIALAIVGDPGVANELVVDQLDDLADDLIDELSGQPHLLGAGTILGDMSAVGGELEIGGVMYPAVIVTLLGRIEETKL